MTQLEHITDLLIEFDEMGMAPRTTVPDPEIYAIEWKQKLTNAISLYASEVAREIFEEIGELINEYLDGRSYRHEFLTKIAELKKKYTEDKDV